jgi:hypothetical protein
MMGGQRSSSKLRRQIGQAANPVLGRSLILIQRHVWRLVLRYDARSDERHMQESVSQALCTGSEPDLLGHAARLETVKK